MFFKETSRNPLINCISDVIDKFLNSGLILFLGPLNGLEEELNEALKRVLIHVVNDAERNTQEIQHSTFSSDRPIDFSLGVNVDLSLFSFL